jgi:hypothetical protein
LVAVTVKRKLWLAEECPSLAVKMRVAAPDMPGSGLNLAVR